MSATPVSRPTLNAVAAALLVAAAAHVGHLPVWASAMVPAAIALRLALGRAPGRWILVPLVIASFAAVLFQFRSISGTTAGGTFFSAMLGLKFLESRDTRDAGLLVCLAYFHATSVFLSSQSIGMAVYILVSITITTVALTYVAAPLSPPSGPPLRLRLRTAAVVLAQATPIMLILFVLFPRIPGPLWGLGDEQSSARTGLSDRMSPGSITRLTESSEVAFRVQFENQPPDAEQRYWRGPVFWRYDGRTWSRGDRAIDRPPRLEPSGEETAYVLILEPHDRRWLFGLDIPFLEAGGGQRRSGYNLVLDDPLRSVRRFEMHSVLDYRLEPQLPNARRERALQLPDDGASRARELAARWRTDSESDAAVIQRALRHFREQGFTYTLSPPALGANPVDEFLFGTRAGFCEHYASAFTVLMRAAGIPARVVTGYLGGERNELGDYLIVRQSDAHAWSEVWLPGEGWTRVDPTGAVSSERLQFGISSVAGAAERLSALSRSNGGWIKSLGLAWDSVNHRWNRVVLGYGPALQERLLSRLGLADLGRYALGAMAIIVAGLLVAAVWLLSARQRPPADPGRRAWLRAIRHLRRSGIEPDPREPPLTLAQRVRRTRPDLAPAFDRIAGLYATWRYGRSPGSEVVEKLQAAVREFRAARGRAQAQSRDSTGED